MLRLVIAGALSLICTLALAQPGPGPQPSFSGGTLSQELILTPSTTGASGLNVAPGVAPASPAAGDLWATSTGLFARFGGVTTGPITGAAGSTGQLQTNSSGALAGIALGGDCTFSTPNVTCTKTSGATFAPSATTDTTNAANISAGTLAAGRMPALTGDVTSSAGSVATTIASGAVTGAKIASATVANANLAVATQNTVKGAATSTAEADLAVPSCSTANSALSWTTNTGPGCNTALANLTTADQTITGGANVTSLSLTTGNVTIDCGARPLQFITNGGAFTITAPTSDGSCMVLTTNNASAGTITFSGFAVGVSTGDTLTTTNTSKFSISVWRINGTSGYRVAAHQ